MPIIDTKNKLIFILIPKTGTTSLENFYIKNFPYIKNSFYNLPKHATALRIKKKIKNYNEYHKVAIVRNPFDLYVSWYTYRQRDDARISSKKMSFSNYVKWNPGSINRNLPDQMTYITDKKNNIIVDEIIIYNKNIYTDIYRILDRNNINFIKQKRKKNISTHRIDKNYKKYYNKETIKLVKKYQYDTIKHFNFKY